ncbi:uncharacterized protein LOC114273348 [Camellia sinensis]|uniref:uncharacterized protein LOC114273348 n=1 Tax=Camellia sinensis TaxID=4442 RepID=UPI001036B30F|nr:uncharacterized protein LOC114273348 [Camellia sinensis]
MLGCKACATPLEPNQKLEDGEGGEAVDRGSYQRLVGKLIYLSHSRPDIAVTISVVSQFMHAPHQIHFEAVMRILRYLKSALDKDADWTGSVIDRRSTSGYCTFVGGNLVTWRSKKQNMVAMSRDDILSNPKLVTQGSDESQWSTGGGDESCYQF